MENIMIDYTDITYNMIGDRGIGKDDFKNSKEEIKRAVQKISSEELRFRKLPYEDYSDVIEYGRYIRDNFESFLLLGIGGSALGPKALFKATCHAFHNGLPKDVRKAPKCYFEDNVDPDRISDLLDVLDLSTTCINVISKSGKTIETLSQMMIIIKKLQEVKPDSWTENLVFTTDKENGILLDIAKKYNIKTFYIPSEVGGRFSIFTPVGILAGAVCGCNIEKVLAGARHMNERCLERDYTKNPAFMYAILQYIAMQKGKNISVMMPYTDNLKFVTDWFSQLWAESLGKKIDNDGNIVNVGQTPVRALGSVDQHSQLQLYMEGPYDKVITLIKVKKHRKKVVIPKVFEDVEDIQFLAGQTLNKLINSELEAVAYALTDNDRPNIVIKMANINEESVGQLFMMLEVATVFAGYLLNINPFDQPGVEHGKISTYALMGKEGFEERRQQLETKRLFRFTV